MNQNKRRAVWNTCRSSDGLTVGQISNSLMISKQNVACIASQLVKQGMLTASKKPHRRHKVYEAVGVTYAEARRRSKLLEGKAADHIGFRVTEPAKLPWTMRLVDKVKQCFAFVER